MGKGRNVDIDVDDDARQRYYDSSIPQVTSLALEYGQKNKDLDNIFINGDLPLLKVVWAKKPDLHEVIMEDLFRRFMEHYQPQIICI